MQLEELVDLMVRKKILRAKVGDVEAELHPSAFGAPAPVNHPEPQTAPDADRCACSHSIAIEHNEMGCLRGCPTEQCARTEASDL